MSTSAASNQEVYNPGRFNAVLDKEDRLSSLPPLLALQFLGFAFSEQGENSLRITNERLDRIRQDLDDVNEAIAIIQSLTGEDGEENFLEAGTPEYDLVTRVLEKYDIKNSDSDQEVLWSVARDRDPYSLEPELPDGLAFSDEQGKLWVEELQTESTALSNDLQRLITQAQSEGSRVEQGNSFGESARQTSDTNVDVLLGRA